MQLPADPVLEWEDITLNFENLAGVLTTPGANLPFLQLLSAQQAAVNWGTGALTFTASDTSAVLSVAHGLGRTPKVVLATGTAFLMWFVVTSPGATNFSIQGQVKASGTGTSGFYWLAIG